MLRIKLTFCHTIKLSLSQFLCQLKKRRYKQILNHSLRLLIRVNPWLHCILVSTQIRLILQYIVNMTKNTSYSLYKRRYAQISVKKRKAIVRLVLQDGKSLSEAGRKLHINPSTVRLIVKKYKETGTYFMKRLRNTPKDIEPTSVESQSCEILVKIEADKDREYKMELNKTQMLANKQKRKEPQNKVIKPWQYPFMCYSYLY